MEFSPTKNNLKRSEKPFKFITERIIYCYDAK